MRITLNSAVCGVVLLTLGFVNCAKASVAPPIEKPCPTRFAAPFTVRDALDVALLNSPRAASARAQIFVARATLWGSLSYPNPGYEWDTAKVEQTFRHGVVFNLESPWNVVLRVLSARKQISQAQVEIARNLWTLRGDVRTQYTNLIVARDKAVALKEVFGINEELQNATQQRFKLGDVARLDVFRAQLQTQQAKLQWQQAERIAVQALEQLNIIMGATPEQVIILPALPDGLNHPKENFLLPDVSGQLPPETYFINLAMKNKLDIKVVEQQIAVAQANLRVAYGAIIPNHTISLGQSRVINPDGTTSRGLYSMGSILIPIFDWNQANITKQKALIRKLRVDLLAQRNIVQSQVARAYRTLWNERETIRAYYDHLLPESKHVVELAQASYKEGQSDITAVLVAQQANLQIRSQYYAEVQAYQQAFTDLEQATGTVLQ